jgi:hypothetical protein
LDERAQQEKNWNTSVYMLNKKKNFK